MSTPVKLVQRNTVDVTIETMDDWQLLIGGLVSASGQHAVEWILTNACTTHSKIHQCRHTFSTFTDVLHHALKYILSASTVLTEYPVCKNFEVAYFTAHLFQQFSRFIWVRKLPFEGSEADFTEANC